MRTRTSIYNLILLKQTHGKDAGKNMYILRMHTDRKGKYPGKPEYELVPCLDLRSEARSLLRLEEERLAAKAPPPPTSPSPAAPMGSGDPSPAGAAAAVCKRPRGPAPKGMEWHESDGRWVKRPRGRATLLTDLTGNAKPRGQPPEGMKWDAAAECYVVRGRGFSKRTAPTASPDAENESSQRSRRAGRV